MDLFVKEAICFAKAVSPPPTVWTLVHFPPKRRLHAQGVALVEPAAPESPPPDHDLHNKNIQ